MGGTHVTNAISPVKKGVACLLRQDGISSSVFLVQNPMWEGLLQDPQEVPLEGLFLPSSLLRC